MHYQRERILKMTNNDVINFYMITPTNRNQNRLKRQKENQLPNEKVSFQIGTGPRRPISGFSSKTEVVCWLWKSIKYKITPFSELNYRESQSTTFDPDLHIPNELFENQKFKNVPLELVTGQGMILVNFLFENLCILEFYEFKSTSFMRPHSRTLTKESLEYALGVLRTEKKITPNLLKSPKKKGQG